MRAVGDGPSRADIEAIEAEWPVIEAELAVVDAEIVLAAHGPFAGDLAWRRLRRAEAEVTRRMAAVFAESFGPMDGAA